VWGGVGFPPALNISPFNQRFWNGLEILCSVTNKITTFLSLPTKKAYNIKHKTFIKKKNRADVLPIGLVYCLTFWRQNPVCVFGSIFWSILILPYSVRYKNKL
jgi:hypothetical protein